MRAEYRVETEFTVIPNSTLKIPGLNPEARSTLSWALSTAPEWHISQRQIRKALGMSDHKVRKGIKSLESKGLCHNFKVYDRRHRKKFGDYFFCPFPTARDAALLEYKAIRSRGSQNGRHLSADLVVEVQRVDSPVFDHPDQAHQRPLKETLEKSNSRKSTGLVKKTNLGTSSSSTAQQGLQGNTRYRVPAGASLPVPEISNSPAQEAPAFGHSGQPCVPESTALDQKQAVERPPATPEKNRAPLPGTKGRRYAPVSPTPQECLIGTSNLPLIPPESSDLTCAYTVKRHFQHGFNALFESPKSDSTSFPATFPKCFWRILSQDAPVRPSEKVLVDSEILVALSQAGSPQKAEEAWLSLSEDERHEFGKHCEAHEEPKQVLRALLVARDLLKYRRPALEGYPDTILRIQACLKLPAPTWPIENEILKQVDLLWAQAWRVRYGRAYRFANRNELLRLATCVMYEWGGDFGKFKQIAAAFVAIEDEFTCHTSHSPNVLVKQWRTNAEILDILKQETK